MLVHFSGSNGHIAFETRVPRVHFVNEVVVHLAHFVVVVGGNIYIYIEVYW